MVLKSSIYISNKSIKGEIEGIAFQDNGEMIFNYNGAKVFFEVEVLPDYGANKEIKENNKQKNNTVDNPKTGRMIAINLLLVGIFIGLYIAYISNKKRRLFKL